MLSCRHGNNALGRCFRTHGRRLYSNKVRVFPFVVSKEQAMRELSMKTAIFTGQKIVRTYLRQLFPSVDIDAMQPTRFQPVYIPTWFVDAQVHATVWLKSSREGLEARKNNVEVQFAHACMPGFVYYPLSAHCFATMDLLRTQPAQWSEDMRHQDGDEVLCLPFTLSPFRLTEAARSLPMTYTNLKVLRFETSSLREVMDAIGKSIRGLLLQDLERRVEALLQILNPGAAIQSALMCEWCLRVHNALGTLHGSAIRRPIEVNISGDAAHLYALDLYLRFTYMAQFTIKTPVNGRLQEYVVNSYIEAARQEPRVCVEIIPILDEIFKFLGAQDVGCPPGIIFHGSPTRKPHRFANVRSILGDHVTFEHRRYIEHWIDLALEQTYPLSQYSDQYFAKGRGSVEWEDVRIRPFTYEERTANMRWLESAEDLYAMEKMREAYGQNREVNDGEASPQPTKDGEPTQDQTQSIEDQINLLKKQREESKPDWLVQYEIQQRLLGETLTTEDRHMAGGNS